MNFLNPVILFGLFAASIPLILHLLNLRKLKRIEFSSLKFINELQKTKIRRIRLKQVILLILRTLIIVLIVLAFARPTVKSELPIGGSYAKSSVVILLDNSMSMEVSDEYGNRFKQAKESVREILRTLRQGDEAVIIPMTGSYPEKYSFTRNLYVLKNELSRIKISYAPASFERSISKAYLLLNESKNLVREIFVISDCQRNVFELQGERENRYYEPHTSLWLIVTGKNSKQEVENYSVDSLKMLTQIFYRGMPLEVEATIGNNSGKRVKGLIVSLFLNGERKAQRAVDIEGYEKRRIKLAADTKDFGVIKGYMELERDALEEDNRQYFGMYIPERTSVAVFGDAETRAIETVLKLNEGQLNYVKYRAEEINAVDLNRFDMIVVAGGLRGSRAFEKLREYTENGGSVLLFANKETEDFNTYKEGLKSLGISVKKLGVFPTPLEFDWTDKMHPLFKGVFKGNTDNKKLVESPEINKIMETESGQKIISTAAGNFLSEYRLGKGKILFVSSALDGTWNNFTLTGLFPVLVYRSVFYLTAKEYTGIRSTAGKDLRIVLPKKYTNKKFKITDPNGLEYYKEAAELPSSLILELNHPDIAGVYTIRTGDGKIVELVSINHDPSESVLTKRDDESIRKDIEKFVDKRTEIEFVDAENLSEIHTKARTGTELWQLFVLLALLTAIAEMLVARSSKNDIVAE